jgi:hypothetical protein
MQNLWIGLGIMFSFLGMGGMIYLIALAKEKFNNQ